MNQHPLSGGTLPSRLEGLDLFGQALDRLQPEPLEDEAASDAGLIQDARPHLTLVRPEDHDDSPLAEESLDEIGRASCRERV